MKTDIRTPYDIHTELNHDETVHSPNGVDHITECKECGLKWLFKGNENPITIYPNLNKVK